MITERVVIHCRDTREYVFETVDGKEIDIDSHSDAYWVKVDGITRSFPVANVIMIETVDHV